MQALTEQWPSVLPALVAATANHVITGGQATNPPIPSLDFEKPLIMLPKALVNRDVFIRGMLWMDLFAGIL